MRNEKNTEQVRLLANAELDHVSGGLLIGAAAVAVLAGIGFIVGQGIGDLPPGMSGEEAVQTVGLGHLL